MNSFVVRYKVLHHDTTVFTFFNCTNDFSKSGPNEWLVAAVPFSNVQISFHAVQADAVLADHLGCTEGRALFQTERSTWWDEKAVTFVRLTYREGHRVTTQY